MVQQKSLTVEIKWEQIECETLGETIRNHMHHLGGFIQNRMPNLGRTIGNRVFRLGGTICKYCLAKYQARIFTILSSRWDICRQVQLVTFFRMHLVIAYGQSCKKRVLQVPRDSILFSQTSGKLFCVLFGKFELYSL